MDVVLILPSQLVSESSRHDMYLRRGNGIMRRYGPLRRRTLIPELCIYQICK